MQNEYFEGCTQHVEVTNLFVWNFKGEIIHAAMNFPGSWHDSKLATISGQYHYFLSDKLPRGMAILADSAFVTSMKTTNGKIVRARKTNETSSVPNPTYMAAEDLIPQKVYSSERQSAEWGVRAVKGTFPRLKVQLPTDGIKRLRLIELCCHLYNFRTRYVGYIRFEQFMHGFKRVLKHSKRMVHVKCFEFILHILQRCLT